MDVDVKVSVIVYVKNTERYIRQCVRSVLDQTLQAMEILIVDGGSTDGTPEIVEEMRRQDGRIRILHAPGSVGAQFNLGLREARGEYIGICEADDYILPDMYEKQYGLASENRLDVVRAGYYQICSVGPVEYRFEQKACYENGRTDRVIEVCGDSFFLEQGLNGFWSGLYRRQFLLEHGIWMNETKGAAYQDISFSFLAQMYAKRVWFMKESFYCYRIDNPHASANHQNGIELHGIEYEKLKERLIALGVWEQNRHMVLSWEMMSYRWFLKGLSGILQKEYAQDVYFNLKKQVEKEPYEKEKILKHLQDTMEGIFKGKAEFVERILCGTEENSRLERYIATAFRKERRVILFGMGHMGRIVKEYLELCGKEILRMDNHPLLENVNTPEELAEHFAQESCLIANIAHAEEMREQLLNLGIPEEKIFLCRDEEFFLRKIFVRGMYVER